MRFGQVVLFGQVRGKIVEPVHIDRWAFNLRFALLAMLDLALKFPVALTNALHLALLGVIEEGAEVAKDDQMSYAYFDVSTQKQVILL